MSGWQSQDYYFRLAKKEGYPARSVYKLEEINRRLHLLRRGQRVLDLGCYPGAWLHYCASIVGQHGLVVGVDLQRPEVQLPARVRFVQADVFELAPAELYKFSKEFDVVLSDLAPATSGIGSLDSTRSSRLLRQALRLADNVLGPDGHFVGKLFLGADFDTIIEELRTKFRRVRAIKPRASRKRSKELYLAALGKRG